MDHVSQPDDADPRGRQRASAHRSARLGIAGIRVGLFVLMSAGCAEMPVPDPAVRYIAFGDSATAGRSARDYPDILRELLGEPPQRFANEGVGGETAGEGFQRLRWLIDQQIYPNAHTLLYWEGGGQVVDFIAEVDPFLLLRPDAADYPYANRLDQLLDEIQAQIEAAIAAGHSQGWRVCVATYYMLPEFAVTCEQLLLDIMLPLQARNGSAYIAWLNERIRLAATKQSAILVDIAAVEGLTDEPDNFLDCNHLSVQGNQIVAARFHDVLTATSP